MEDRIFTAKPSVIKELISLANNLDSKGLTKEADRLDYIINKVASTAPSISRFKTLLAKVLENSGYTVSDKPGEADIHIDPANQRWTRNLSYAWTRFAENVLKINEVASNWKEVSKTVGTGYSPTLGGMIDLLSDFTAGGRAQVGANLGTLGEGGLAEQTPEMQQSAEGQRAVNQALRPLGIPNERLDRSRDFEDTNERLLQEQRARQNTPEEGSQEGLPQESEAMANIGPEVPQSTGDQVYSWGEWEQKRDDSGNVSGYRRKGELEWMDQGMFETRNVGGRMKTQPVNSDQRSFRLGLGGTVGERPVANIGKKPLPRNRGSWTSSK